MYAYFKRLDYFSTGVWADYFSTGGMGAALAGVGWM
jgi:hypothetical protein